MLHKTNKTGFTMIELLVVLVIIAILAAVAAPLYLANTKRSKMSEAIATMSLLRQSERDFKVNHNAYYDVKEDATPSVSGGRIQLSLPAGTIPTNGDKGNAVGLDVGVGTAQYFSNGAFFIDASNDPSIPPSITPSGSVFTANNGQPAVDFIVFAKGNNSFQCTSTAITDAKNSCAVKAGEISSATDGADYEAMMDNSGRIFVCYGTTSNPCTSATNWSAY